MGYGEFGFLRQEREEWITSPTRSSGSWCDSSSGIARGTIFAMASGNSKYSRGGTAIENWSKAADYVVP